MSWRVEQVLWTTVGRKHRNRRNERGRGVHNKNTQDVLNWHACKLDLDVTCTGNGWTNAQRGILIFSYKKECDNWL